MKGIIIGLCIILLIPFTSAQGGGGYTQLVPLTPEEFYEMSNNFTKCLIDYCDYFCKEFGFSEGDYYKEKKCWCEIYTTTSHGRILSDKGWIGIQECSQEEINIKSELDVSSPTNIIKQRDILTIGVGVALSIIIILSIVIYQLRKK